MDDLLELEKGIVVYDAWLDKKVMIKAPVMLIIADNPMASELCNHQGSTAIRFCRMCLVIMHNPIYLLIIMHIIHTIGR